MDPGWLSRARIRPVRSDEDLARTEEFLGSPRVRAVAEGHPEEPGAIRVCELDGEIKAALILDPTPLRLRDVEVRCARFVETGGEDGRDYFRETGDKELFTFMLEEALGYVWVKRYPIAYVHGELGLYPEHGFVPCFFHPRVFVAVEDALAVRAPYRVRHLKADDVPRIQAMRHRDRRWKPVVHSAGVRKFRHFSVEAPDRSLKGFMSLEADVDSEWTPKLFAPEIEADDRGAACTIVRHCAEKARDMGLKEMHFPLGAGHRVARLCLELGGQAVLRGVSTDPFLDEEMIHLVDPCRLVRAFAPFFERRLRLLPDRAAHPAIGIATDVACWRLLVEPTEVRMEALDVEAEDDVIRIPHWMLTQFLVGYRGVEDLDVDVPEEQAEVLKILLPKSWPLSLPDPDLWEDIFPPLPLCDEAVAAVRNARLPWAALDAREPE